MAAVDIHGLRTTYDARPVVHDLDLEIDVGECFAPLGPNGAGKTTTVEILEGFRRRDGGTYRSYAATRGWSAAALDAAAADLADRGWLTTSGWALTDAGRRARQQVEDQIDAQEQAIVDAVGLELATVVARLDRWDQRRVDAGTFPADVG